MPAFLADLNLKQFRREDHTLRTAAMFATTFEFATASAILGVFAEASKSNALLGALLTTFATVGIDFAHPLTQDLIDSLVLQGAFSAEMGAQLKALGVSQLSLAETMGGEATLANVTDALALLAKEPLYAEADARYHAVLASISDGTIQTSSALVAQFGA